MTTFNWWLCLFITSTEGAGGRKAAVGAFNRWQPSTKVFNYLYHALHRQNDILKIQMLIAADAFSKNLKAQLMSGVKGKKKQAQRLFSPVVLNVILCVKTSIEHLFRVIINDSSDRKNAASSEILQSTATKNVDGYILGSPRKIPTRQYSSDYGNWGPTEGKRKFSALSNNYFSPLIIISRMNSLLRQFFSISFSLALKEISIFSNL